MRLNHAFRPVRHFFDEMSKVLGFRSAPDLLESAYNLKAYPLPVLKLYVGSVSALSVASFVTRWLWEPPIAAGVLLFCDLANAWYGYRVAVTLKGDRFRLTEMGRTGGKIVATLIVMGIVHHTINAYTYAALLADVVFWWLFGGKFGKLGLKMTALKVQESGLPKLLQGFVGQLLQTKLGPYLVDALQQRQPARPSVFSPATSGAEDSQLLTSETDHAA